MVSVFVSVIMPVRNEARYIAASLGAALRQDYPSDRMEILLVDGASEDATLELVASLPGSERVQVLSNPRRVQAAGMNVGLAHARGDFIVRVDGHTIIAPDYVRQCVHAWRETGAHNVGGALSVIGVSDTGKAIAAATRCGFAVPGAFHSHRADGKTYFTDTVYLGAWPRSVLDHVGGFDEMMSPNEDYELNYRIRAAGGRIYLSPAIRSGYFGRQTLLALALQHFHYGVGKTRVLRKSPRSLRPRQLVAPVFVGTLVVGLGVALFSPLARALWLGIVLAYSVLNLVFSVRMAIRTNVRLFWRLPAVFATMHVAWGTGFWIGWLVPRRYPSVTLDLPGSHTSSAATPATRTYRQNRLPARVIAGGEDIHQN